jgi:hypothetical protein
MTLEPGTRVHVDGRDGRGRVHTYAGTVAPSSFRRWVVVELDRGPCLTLERATVREVTR